MLLKVVQLKKENLLQCFGLVFFFFFWNVLGGERKEQKAGHAFPKTRLPKVILNCVLASIMVTLYLVLQVLPEQQIGKMQRFVLKLLLKFVLI